MPLIVLETVIAAPPERCFDLSLDVDLHQASVAWTRERAVGGVMTGVMGLGDEVTWSARHLGRTWRMTSRITAWERPVRFVDEMVSGPFRSFGHEHLFESMDGMTRMVDRLQYQAPLGALGHVADLLFLERYMRSLLLARNRHLTMRAESAGA
jgi:ligand-binding SRPBCC domain-containing protein